jgi:hypothetical protein
MKTSCFLSDEKRATRKAFLKIPNCKIPDDVVPKLMADSPSRSGSSSSNDMVPEQSVSGVDQHKHEGIALYQYQGVPLGQFHRFLFEPNVTRLVEHQPATSNYQSTMSVLSVIAREMYRPLSAVELVGILNNDEKTNGGHHLATLLLGRMCAVFKMLPDFANMSSLMKYCLLQRSAPLLIIVLSFEMYQPDRECFALTGSSNAVVLVPFAHLVGISQHGSHNALHSVYKTVYQQLFGTSSTSNSNAVSLVCIAMVCMVIFSSDTDSTSGWFSSPINSTCLKFLMALHEALRAFTGNTNTSVMIHQVLACLFLLRFAYDQVAQQSDREKFNELINRLLLPPKF